MKTVIRVLSLSVLLATAGLLPTTAQATGMPQTAVVSNETYNIGFDAGREKRSEINSIYGEGTREFNIAIWYEHDRVQNAYVQGNSDPDSLDYWYGYLDGLTSAP